MRVLYVNPFSQAISGPDESLLALLEALVPLGVEPHVALPAPGPQVARYERLGARVHFVPMSALKRSLRPGQLAGYGLQVTRGALALARIIRRERIALVHTNMEVVLDGGIAARLLRVPHVMHYRGNTIDEPIRVFDALVAIWTRLADHVFCISNATAEIFWKRGHRAHVEALYNPVAVERFRAAVRSDEVRRQLGARDDDVLVGTVGRLHPRKDIETFVRAAARVAKDDPRARFVIVGSAEVPEEHAYEARVRGLAGELGIADRLVWAGARRDMPEVLKALDVFVLCSRHEGFGRVVAEAMAAGLPMVLTDEGAFPEIVRDVRGARLARPQDVRAFADGIRAAPSELEHDPDCSARFDSVAIARRTVARYASLVGPRGTP